MTNGKYKPSLDSRHNDEHLPGVPPGKSPTSSPFGQRFKCFMCGSLDHLLPLRPKEHLTGQVNTATAEEAIIILVVSEDAPEHQMFVVDTDATASIASLQ